MFNRILADDWIRTADLLSRKRTLYQLSHTTAHSNNICTKKVQTSAGFNLRLSK